MLICSYVKVIDFDVHFVREFVYLFVCFLQHEIDYRVLVFASRLRECAFPFQNWGHLVH